MCVESIDRRVLAAHRVAMTSVDGGLGLQLFDDRYIQDPYPLYAQMHETGPVHRVGDSGFYAVSSWKAVNEAVARCSDFSSNLTATMMYRPGGTVEAFPLGERGAPTQALATADDPLHAFHRKLLLPQLAAKRIRTYAQFVADTATRIWDSKVTAGRIEWMSAMANRLPMMIVARIIGVPDDDTETLARWGYAATQLVEGLVSPEELQAALASALELGGYINEQFQDATAEPRDNLLGDLARAAASGDLDDVAALTMMITLFSAGGESTASLIGSGAWILATFPDIQRRLRDDPGQLGLFVEEVLRYEPPFRGHYRHVVNETELCDVALPAGSRLLLLWGAANRDPQNFEDPDEFRLDRTGAKGHITFGKGVHFCVGAALARLEATTVLGHLLEQTTDIRAVETGRWLPSMLVRRLEHLTLAVS